MSKTLTCIIDIADTVFPKSTGIRERFNLRVAEAAQRFETVFRENGIELKMDADKRRIENLPHIIRALQARNPVAHNYFLDYCYDANYLDLQSFRKNPDLIAHLKRIGFENVGFYSSDPLLHVRCILNRLGLTRSMVPDSRIIDVYKGGDLPKPTREGFLGACEKLGFDPKHTAVFDDWQSVLSTASAEGAITIWINEQGLPPQRGLRTPDFIVPDINAGFNALFECSGNAPDPFGSAKAVRPKRLPVNQRRARGAEYAIP